MALRGLGVRTLTKKLLICLCCGVIAVSAFASEPPARELLAAGRVDDAIRSANQRLKDHPEDAEAQSILCRTYFALEIWGKAVQACERAVSLAPANSEFHMWLGRVYGERANHANFLSAIGWAKKARRELEIAVQLDASNIEARSDLAEFYVDAPSFIGGGTGKARLEAAQIAGRNAAWAHFLNSRIAEKEKDFAAAENELRAAITDSDDPGGDWLNLASFYERRGRHADMEQAINKGLAVNKRKTHVLFYAAEMLFRTGRSLPAAADLVRKYLMGTPDEEAPPFHAHYLLGNILESQGKRDEAEREYRAALALAKDFDKARERLARSDH